MTDSTANTFDLLYTYIHLPDGAAADPVPVDEEFWTTIDSRTELHGGRLVTLHRYVGDWPAWEMHPADDEVLYLLGGSVDTVLEVDGGERVIELRGRAACIVPRGVWHRAVVHEPGDVLHITPGAGTEHRSV